MSDRVRHCVQCPKCQTWYILAFSPYGNGALLVPTIPSSSEEYILYCSCAKPRVVSRWRWCDVLRCAVSQLAHQRGYGSSEEVVITHQIRSRRS